MTNPSVLAFERKLDPSDGLFHAGNWEMRDHPQEWRPIALREKLVRGTNSSRHKTKDQDPAKLDAPIEDPNLQRVDSAMLPPAADTLRVTFNLRVLPGVGRPSACNKPDYQQTLEKAVLGYATTYGFGELSQRYAYNLANGRFLWRNRFCADEVKIQIHWVRKGVVQSLGSFTALSLPLREFPTPESATEDLKAVATAIEQGLSGDRPVFLEVTAFARIGAGQEAYPSQELIQNPDDSKKVKKSKTLYSVDGVAAMHSQKIGNALRTIDTWYPEADALDLGPIAVEPYGSVTSRGTAYRHPNLKMDFYTLLDNWILKGKAPEPQQQHFVMATLIRGGVFSCKKQD